MKFCRNGIGSRMYKIIKQMKMWKIIYLQKGFTIIKKFLLYFHKITQFLNKFQFQ